MSIIFSDLPEDQESLEKVPTGIVDPNLPSISEELDLPDIPPLDLQDIPPMETPEVLTRDILEEPELPPKEEEILPEVPVVTSPVAPPVVQQEEPVMEEPAPSGATVPTNDTDFVRSLANFIGKKEAPKGYNQIQGDNKFAPLNTMSVDDVLNYQRGMIPRGHESTAVGRYQIIHKTLRGLKENMGLSGNELMTPELQDKMFVELARGRGLDSYLAGEINIHEFGNNLSKEWASLPVVKDIGRKRAGMSYWAGTGSNMALVDTDTYLNVLRQLKSPGEVIEEEPEMLSHASEKGSLLYTIEGRPIYENQWGDAVTERTITEQINGKWYNIPTVYDGQFVEDIEAVDRVLSTEQGGSFFDPLTGRELEPFDNVNSAVKAAEERSKSLEGPTILRKEEPKIGPKLFMSIDPITNEEVGAIESEVVTEPSKAWENTFNFAQSMGLERATSQRLADVAAFIADLSPSSSADVLRAGSEKIVAGRPTEGLTDILTTTIPVVGDVGAALFLGAKKSTKGRDSSFVQAMKKVLSGKNKEMVRQETGWFRGRDGEWRFEIDDSQAKILLDRRKSTVVPDMDFLRLPMTSAEKGIPLDQVIDHPELFLQYPQLREIEVFDTPPFAFDLSGAYLSESKKLLISASKSDEKAKSIILHEIQHAIQDIEGFISGASTKSFLPKGFDTIAPKIKKRASEVFEKAGVNKFFFKSVLRNIKEGRDLVPIELEKLQKLKDSGMYEEAIDALEAESLVDSIEHQAFVKYQSVAGEVEARNVEERMDLTPEQRRLVSPFITESVPPEKQIKSPLDKEE